MKKDQKTNKQLASEMKTTSRQIAKSRKRGWIWIFTSSLNDKVKYTAPPAVHLP